MGPLRVSEGGQGEQEDGVPRLRGPNRRGSGRRPPRIPGISPLKMIVLKYRAPHGTLAPERESPSTCLRLTRSSCADTVPNADLSAWSDPEFGREGP